MSDSAATKEGPVAKEQCEIIIGSVEDVSSSTCVCQNSTSSVLDIIDLTRVSQATVPDQLPETGGTKETEDESGSREPKRKEEKILKPLLIDKAEEPTEEGDNVFDDSEDDEGDNSSQVSSYFGSGGSEDSSSSVDLARVDVQMKRKLRRMLQNPALDSTDRNQAQRLERQWTSLGWTLRCLERQRHSTLKSDNTKSPIDPSDKKSRQPSNFSVKVLAWADYKKTMGKRVPVDHNAIDVLVQDPEITQTLRSRKKGQAESSIQQCTEPESPEPSRTGPPDVRPTLKKTLPSRIRVNSVPARRILDGLVGDALNFYDAIGFPLVLIRPFKLLVHIEQDIRDRLSKMIEDFRKLNTKEPPLVTEQGPTKMSIRDRPTDHLLFSSSTWEHLTKEEVEEAIRDFRCVTNFIDDYISPLRNYMRDPAHVRFSELWYLFPQGSYVFVSDKSIPHKVWRVVQAVGGRKYLSAPEKTKGNQWEDKYSSFSIGCYYLDFDGQQFVPVFRNFYIDHFPELRPIEAMSIVPLAVAEKQNLINRENLLARGQQFLKCTTPTYMYYEGRSLSQTPEGTHLTKFHADGSDPTRVYSETIESQVMVDFDRALQAMPEWLSFADNVVRAIRPEDAEFSDRWEELCDDDRVWDTAMREEFIEEERAKWKTWRKEGQQPNGDDLLLLPDRVFAFVFRTRSWGKHPFFMSKYRVVVLTISSEFATWPERPRRGASEKGTS